MKHCQECDSEVADNDIFCPYCGISMQVAETVSSADDDAFTKTIVIAASDNIVEPAINLPVRTDEGNDSYDDTEKEETISVVAADDEISDSSATSIEDPEIEAPEADEYKEFDVISQDQKDEFAEDAPQVQLLEEEDADGLTEAGPIADVLDNEEKEIELDNEPHIAEPDISDVPTPILLADEGIDTTKKATDSPEISLSSQGIDIPEDVDVLNPSVEDISVESNAVLPLLTNTESEEEPAFEPDMINDQPVEPMPDDSNVEDEAHQINEVVAPQVIEEVDTPADIQSPELNFSEDVTSNDGAPAEVQSGTTPITDSTDTDGRRSGLKPLAEGTVLNNRYDIVRKIGGGGMGAVYLACDRNLGGVQRAVKEMVQSHIEEEQQEKAVEDFKRESMILSTLDHPSIPTIYDYFFDNLESRFYLVMKYISGGDLAGKLRSTPEGRVDERTVTEWALQIIDVLEYLHNLPTTIVYRDLKPSNVMIDGNSGRVMLIDFGIARSINQTQEKGVTAVGTMGYAPPELFSGNVEPRSDIYSLGSTMFHLLTGADPQNNPLLIFDFQKNPRPRQINPQLSDQIERILMRSVEYNADARFNTASEMKLALASHLDNLKTGQITYGVSEVPQSVSLSHQIVFCGFCGQRIVATDMFCAFCGSKQPLAQQGVHREVYSPSVGTARLIIEGTNELNVPAYSIEKRENLVGRRDPMSNIFPEVDLSKYDPQTKISRRHAKIWRDGGSFLIEDLGSSNGTILLTKISDTLRLMPHQPHPLTNGDRLRIGDTTLQFIVE